MKKLLSFLAFFLLGVQLNAQDSSGLLQCEPETYDLLKKLSESSLGKGEIYLFTTTHQDIAWLDHPENCIINRDTMWLTPFLERLATDPTFKMDIEQSSIVMEYLHRHPEKKVLIQKYLDEGRICVGATFMQPYEEMYSGEALARQFYFGKKWLKNTFNYNPLSYFNVDVPGRTLQMPQIMQKAGVENLIISRHERGLFYWEAPDGSKVRTYTPGHYIFFYNLLGEKDSAAIKSLAQEAVLWYTRFNDCPKAKAVMPAMLNYEFIWDQRNVQNCVPFMSKWNSIKSIEAPGKKKINVNLPPFRYAIADDFFNTLDKSTSSASLKVYKGERPNVWIYIHGPSHEQAITLSRQGDILLPAAEKFSTFNLLADKSYVYPDKQLNQAWEAKIYPDHGWGGKNGNITDLLFLRKYEYALTASKQILQSAQQNIASSIQKQAQGMPVVVFNSVSWEREDLCSVDIHLASGFAKNVQLKDANNKSLASQLSRIEYHKDGSIRSAKLHFMAKVPALGYATFYLNPSETEITKPEVNKDIFENTFYQVSFASGGIRQIWDKELGVDLLDISKFLGSEIICMQSVGNGAGEFDKVQLPTMEGFDKVSNHTPKWSIAEAGDIYVSYKYRSPIRNAVIEQEVKIYQQTKKIDFNISILNWEGILYREYRMMLPLSLHKSEISYDVPYGILTVGKDEMPGAAGERYLTDNREQHPRGIGNWIAVSGENFGITLSSSVAVADYIDPTDNPASNTILQPVLLASRKSCHWEGEGYFQHGDHHYSFSLSSHRPSKEKSLRFGQASVEKLEAIFNPSSYQFAKLPESLSFFTLDNPNIIVSAIKKSEDDENIIVRLYNLSNKEEKVKLKSWREPKQIFKVNLIEEEASPVNEMVLGAYSIETYKLHFD